MHKTGNNISVSPAGPEQWRDLQNLFGQRGACGGCWCMYWRLSHRDYEAKKGERNKALMAALVKQNGLVPGLIAYDEATPVGWCTLAPREDYVRLSTSRILKPVDDKAVWSLPCLFVAKSHRRMGLSKSLISAAIDYAASQGAEILEAYPVEPSKDNVPPVFAFTGIASAFSACGFKEVARRSDSRPIMRIRLHQMG